MDKLKDIPILGSMEMQHPTYKETADGTVYSIVVAKTDGASIYFNLFGNVPFINPDAVTFIDVDGKSRPKNESVLNLDAGVWGATNLDPDAWAGTCLLHELAHITKKLSDEQDNLMSSMSNSQTIYEECFK